jgi:RNA polymerase sigma-70 factor (ECF subfamily)
LSGICEEEAIAIERCRRGSPDAFEVIVRRYMKRAYFIALGLVGNRDDALDLSQEAFFRAYDNIDHLHSDRKFFPWFYQILKNLCFTHLRKKSRRQTTTLDNIDDQEVTTENNAAFDPEAIAERGELKKQVWKAIGKLGDKHREVIILRHFQNLSYDQMADVLFCSKGTVMSRLYHARRKLKDLLDSEKGGQ